MAKVEVSTRPKRCMRLPLVMAIADKVIRELRFVEVINESVSWDRSHWNISPGGLAKMLVLSTFTDIRVPLTVHRTIKMTFSTLQLALTKL